MVSLNRRNDQSKKNIFHSSFELKDVCKLNSRAFISIVPEVIFRYFRWTLSLDRFLQKWNFGAAVGYVLHCHQFLFKQRDTEKCECWKCAGVVGGGLWLCGLSYLIKFTSSPINTLFVHFSWSVCCSSSTNPGDY